MILSPLKSNLPPNIDNSSSSCPSSSHRQYENPPQHSGLSQHQPLVSNHRFDHSSSSPIGSYSERQLPTSSHPLNSLSSDDSSLPSYESVVSSAQIPASVNPASYNRHQAPPTSGTSEQNFQSPPPSYFRQSDRSSHHSRTDLCPVTSGARSSRSNNLSAGAAYNYDVTADARWSNQRNASSYNNNNERRTSSSPRNLPALGLLSNQFKKPLEAVVWPF